MKIIKTILKMLETIFNTIVLVSLVLGGVGITAYYVIESLVSFNILSLNMVEIGDIFWEVIYVFIGSFVCSLILSKVIDKISSEL